MSHDVSGSWRLEVELSANQRFRGTEQVRGLELDGERLTLSADNGERRHVLEWRRA